jgi:hypothetical protein
MLLKNILGEPQNKLSIILGDSTNLREVLKPFAAFLGGPLVQGGLYTYSTPLYKKLENRELSCHQGLA